jgi:hypothetical protein
MHQKTTLRIHTLDGEEHEFDMVVADTSGAEYSVASRLGRDSGVRCQVGPECVPVAVEVGGPQGRDSEGAVLAPVHAGAVERQAHQLLGRRFEGNRGHSAFCALIAWARLGRALSSQFGSSDFCDSMKAVTANLASGPSGVVNRRA